VKRGGQIKKKQRTRGSKSTKTKNVKLDFMLITEIFQSHRHTEQRYKTIFDGLKLQEEFSTRDDERNL
jgi:hypothetical protein